MDLTLPGYSHLDLKPGGAQVLVSHTVVAVYVWLVAETSVMPGFFPFAVKHWSVCLHSIRTFA